MNIKRYSQTFLDKTFKPYLTLRDCLGLDSINRDNEAATVSVRQATGAGPSNTSITNLRLNTDDTANPGTVNPLVKPSAGNNYSYVKWVYLNADTTPSNAINNLKIYYDNSAAWTGVTLNIGASATYTQASGTPGTTGNASTLATTDIGRYSSSSTAKSLSGSISNPSTGRISDYVAFQGKLTTSAVAGTLAAKTVTFQYDET